MFASKESAEAGVKILWHQSRGSCGHPQSLDQGVCRWWWYKMCSRCRRDQCFQWLWWQFELYLILYGWSLVFIVHGCTCLQVLPHVSMSS